MRCGLSLPSFLCGLCVRFFSAPEVDIGFRDGGRKERHDREHPFFNEVAGKQDLFFGKPDDLVSRTVSSAYRMELNLPAAEI